MDRGAVRRTVTVLLAYAAVACVVLLVGGWLRRVLALPPLFDDLLTWGLWGGASVAALMAWHYPAIATGGGPAGPEDPRADDDPDGSAPP